MKNKLKKSLSILLSILMLMSITAGLDFSAYADDSGTNITWSYNSDNNTLTISGTGDMTNCSSNSSVPWYTCKSTIRKVVINTGVTSIGSYAFSHCYCLTSVTIPDSVTSIGERAFEDCTSLKSVTIPNSVTSIGDYAFSDCYSLTSVTIPDSVTSIGEDAFYYCKSLTSVTIPNSVTSIEEYEFYHCESLTRVTIGNSVTSIGDYAFDWCTSLTSVTIGNSVTSIGKFAFDWCTSLKSVTIPNSVTSIGIYAFSGCTSLTSVSIPNSVTSIEEYAFEDCEDIETVNYDGCSNEWSKITIGSNNTYLTNATRNYLTCTSTVTNPTCTEQGYTTYTCSRCGDTYTGNPTEALGHKYVKKVVSPTCTAQGYTTYTCSRCGDTYTGNSKKALGHNFVNGVCTRCKKSAIEITSVKGLKGRFKIKWKSLTKVAGYQIQVSTTKSFKKGTVNVKNFKNKSSINVGAHKGKYYIRVRTYTMNKLGKKNFSNWSKVKSVKVK